MNKKITINLTKEELIAADIYGLAILFILCFDDFIYSSSNEIENLNNIFIIKQNLSKGQIDYKNFIEFKDYVIKNNLCYFELSDVLSTDINKRKFLNCKKYQPLPPDWVKAIDPKSKKHYYYNISKKQSQWEIPIEESSEEETIPRTGGNETIFHIVQKKTRDKLLSISSKKYKNTKKKKNIRKRKNIRKTKNIKK
jgi:hypothetical protein